LAAAAEQWPQRQPQLQPQQQAWPSAHQQASQVQESQRLISSTGAEAQQLELLRRELQAQSSLSAQLRDRVRHMAWWLIDCILALCSQLCKDTPMIDNRRSVTSELPPHLLLAEVVWWYL
jgi:hypothetical protein